MLWFAIGQVLLGGLLLYLGAEWLVKGSAGLARALGVRPLVIGLTVVAYGTSAPELAVSVRAALLDRSAIALGNVIGSNIANLGLILGLTTLFAPPRVDGSLLRREIPWLLGATLAVPLLLFDGRIGRVEGGLLVLAAVIFTAVLLFSSRGPGVPSAQEAESGAESGGAPPGQGNLRLGIIAGVGLALLLSGGELLVRGAVELARAAGLSDELVGATIVAVGTSVPELAASIVAALRGHAALAVGNVVGSNIFNALLILGGAALARPLHGELRELRPELGFLLGMTCLGALLLRKERVLRRFEGALLLLGYAAFLTIMILR